MMMASGLSRAPEEDRRAQAATPTLWRPSPRQETEEERIWRTIRVDALWKDSRLCDAFFYVAVREKATADEISLHLGLKKSGLEETIVGGIRNLGLVKEQNDGVLTVTPAGTRVLPVVRRWRMAGAGHTFY